MVAVVQEQVLGQAPSPRAGAVLATVAFALQPSGDFELLQHAVQRGPGWAGLFDQRLPRVALVLHGDHLQQREQTHRRGVDCEFAADLTDMIGSLGRCCFHRDWIMSSR